MVRRVTTSGITSFNNAWLSVHPEPRRRVPKEFSHTWRMRESFSIDVIALEVKLNLDGFPQAQFDRREWR
jgi:hypothetical protein